MLTIDVEQAAFVITRKFPQLVRYVDWEASHPLRRIPETGEWEQCGPSWVPLWRPADIPQPTPEDLVAWWPEYKDEYELSEASRQIRQRRDDLLVQADVLIERAADDENLELVTALRSYRKALRAIPEQPGFPFDVRWPTLPNSA